MFLGLLVKQTTFYTLFCVCSLPSKGIFSLDTFLTAKKMKYVHKWSKFNVKNWPFPCEIILINNDPFQKISAKKSLLETYKYFSLL